MWLFSYRRGSPYETGQKPGELVLLAVSRPSFSKRRPSVPESRIKNADSYLNQRTLSRKTKCADFKMKSAAFLGFSPGATGNRSPLQIPDTSEKRGNTGLLTCVRECQSLLRPHPTFSQVFPAMADFRPGGLLRFGVASRAQHRFVSA